MQLKALLIKDDLERSELLKQSLLEFGHDVVAEATMTDDLLKRVEATQPDLLVIDSDSPGKVLLSRLRELALYKPLPVVLFTEEDNREVIHQAVRAGVSAYIVDGLAQHRLGAILDVAGYRLDGTDRGGNAGPEPGAEQVRLGRVPERQFQLAGAHYDRGAGHRLSARSRHAHAAAQIFLGQERDPALRGRGKRYARTESSRTDQGLH